MHAKICIVSKVVCRVGEHQHGKSVDCRKKNSRSVCYIIYNKGQFPHVFIRVILLYVYLFVIVECPSRQSGHASAIRSITALSQGHVILVPMCVWVGVVGLHSLLAMEDAICVLPFWWMEIM